MHTLTLSSISLSSSPTRIPHPRPIQQKTTPLYTIQTNHNPIYLPSPSQSYPSTAASTRASSTQSYSSPYFSPKQCTCCYQPARKTPYQVSWRAKQLAWTHNCVFIGKWGCWLFLWLAYSSIDYKRTHTAYRCSSAPTWWKDSDASWFEDYKMKPVLWGTARLCS